MNRSVFRFGCALLLLIMGLCLSGCEGGGGDDGMTQEQWFATVKIGMPVDEAVTAVGRQPDIVRSLNIHETGYGWRFGNAFGSFSFRSDHRVYSVSYSPNMYGD
jgi:hypothetical protein